MQTSTRSVTIEIIVAIVAALVAILLFIPDVGVVFKIALLLSLLLVGIINFAALVGWTQKASWRYAGRQRERTIRRFPQLVVDLYTMNNRLNRVLFERSSDHPSLTMQGAEAVALLAKDSDMAESDEFREKMALLEAGFRITRNVIVGRNAERYRWKSLQFSEVVNALNAQLDSLGNVFATVYRLVGILQERRLDIPDQAKDKWKEFVQEFNPTINEWREFARRVMMSIGYVGESRAPFAKEI